MILQQPPPLPAFQINSNDESHLRAISVCHYVMAGLYLLGIGFVILHFMIMSWVMDMTETQHGKATAVAAPTVIASSPSTTPEGSAQSITVYPVPATASPSATSAAPFPKDLMKIFMFFYVGVSAILVALCVCNALSGHYISKRRNKLFSFVIAGINCMQFPLGTTLGVFTFVVLSRESVKMAYRMNLES